MFNLDAIFNGDERMLRATLAPFGVAKLKQDVCRPEEVKAAPGTTCHKATCEFKGRLVTIFMVVE